MGYSFRLAAKVLLYASSHRQGNTYHDLCYTSRGALAGTTKTVKEFSDTEEKEVDLLKGEHPHPDDMPDRIQPKGLDAKRKWYLFEEIRQFTSKECRNLNLFLLKI